jgi:hypothetical protein
MPKLGNGEQNMKQPIHHFRSKELLGNNLRISACLFAESLRHENPCDPLGRGGFRSLSFDKNPAHNFASYSLTVP